MVKINFIILFLLFRCPEIFAQITIVPDSLVFSGIIINTEDARSLPNVTCRYGGCKGTYADETGRFRMLVQPGDTVHFSYVGFKTAVMIIPDTLIEKEYIVGVFMSPDTLQLSEVLILRRWRGIQRQNMVNAKNNMRGILKQAYAPVWNMDAAMNQRMMIEDYARSVEMRGHVDVKAGVGTQSLETYRRLKRGKNIREEKEWLSVEEVDLLKKIYYLEKKENQDN